MLEINARYIYILNSRRNASFFSQRTCRLYCAATYFAISHQTFFLELGCRVQMVASCKWIFLQLKYLLPWQTQEMPVLADLDLSVAI